MIIRNKNCFDNIINQKGKIVYNIPGKNNILLFCTIIIPVFYVFYAVKCSMITTTGSFAAFRSNFGGFFHNSCRCEQSFTHSFIRPTHWLRLVSAYTLEALHVVIFLCFTSQIPTYLRRSQTPYSANIRRV